MKTNIVGEAWSDYAARVIPVGSPHVQLVESKRAFYAGAQALLYGMLRNMPDTEDEKAEEQFMFALEDELKAFVAQIKKGEA